MARPAVAHPSANNAFISACLDFDDLLARLTAMRENHFGADAEIARNWGEVGSVTEANRMLAEAARFLSGGTAR